MSSISSLGGTDSLQYLWQMAQQDAAIGTNQTRQAPPNGEGPQELWDDVEESAASAGLSEEEVEALKEDMKAAISTAMESAQGSEDREAGHEAVDDAILTTLQEYGVDTTEIENHMNEAKSRMQEGDMPPPPPDQGGMSGGTIASSGTDTEMSLMSLLSSASSSTSSTDTATTLLTSLFPLVDEQA